MDDSLRSPLQELAATRILNRDQKMLRWISSVDHKQIGVMYLLLALVFLVIGGGEALLMRTQLAVANNHFLSPEAYNQIFTMHGTTMVFLVAMPAIFGFGNFMVPLMIGANDMAFPRLNAFSFWMTLFGGGLLYFSFLSGGGPDAGWFNYAPLNEYNYSSRQGIDYYAIGLLVAGVGSVGGAMNFIVTITYYRAKGMKLNMVPLFVWMIFVDSFLILATFAPLNAALAMIELDRLFHAHFFNSAQGGSALLWQHLFWLFGHPEVYVAMLPAFGIFSEIFQTFSRKPIFSYAIIASSSVAIALLSFGVWVHHMFTAGLGNTVNSFFAASSMLIAIPTGIKVFSWVGTMYGGSLKFSVPLMFGIAFLIQFTFGGLTGVAFAIVPIDWQLTDTYFVVAHFHYMFIGGAVFGLLAGLFYWYPKISGKMLDEKLSKWVFWLFTIGFNTTFLIQHVLGLYGMPRRVWTYPDLPGYTAMNFTSTIGAFMMGAASLILVFAILKSRRSGIAAGRDPWDGVTLEWYADPSPERKNFNKIPLVKSRRPLWDLKHPEDPDWKREI